MRSIPGLNLVIGFALSLCSAAVGQPNPPDGGPGGPMPGGPGWGGPRMFVMMDRNVLGETLAILGDVNLSPDFTLSAEQKQKIQTIRDEFKKQQEAWRAEHADELKPLDEQMADLRDAGGPPDPDLMRDIMEARRELMSTAPDGEDEAAQVKALLTPDQLKQFEARHAEVQKERERMRGPFAPGGPGRR